MNQENTTKALADKITRHWLKMKGGIKIFESRVIYDIIRIYVTNSTNQKKPISFKNLAHFIIIHEVSYKNEGEHFEYKTLVKIVQSLEVKNVNIQNIENGKKNS